MSSKWKTSLAWFVLIGVFVALAASNRAKAPLTVPFQEFEFRVNNGDVRSVETEGNLVRFQRRENAGWYKSYGTLNEEMFLKLNRVGVEPKEMTAASKGSLGLGGFETLLYIALAVLIVFLVLYFMAKKGAGTGGMDLMQLSKSRAKDARGLTVITFEDVGGCQDAKDLLGDVIDFLKAPQRWTKLGIRLPRGILLEGPPGSGKTHLARAVAGETGAKFYVVSASEFVELFVGVGSSRMRDMFDTASKNAPAIIFIDEIDAIGRRRGSGLGGSHDEREQTLNQLLVNMDGFQHDARVVVIAATNRPDILDKALLRPGRFDRRIKMPELSLADRVEILKIHTQNKPLAGDVSLNEVAGWTEGFYGAGLESLANEAALLAVRRARQESSEPMLQRDDFRAALKPRQEQTRLFDQLDNVLIESTSQLAEPTGRAVVRLQLRDGSSVEGTVVWADAIFIKVMTEGASTGMLIPKAQVLRMESLGGTESISRDNVSEDRWSRRRSDLA